MYLSAIHSAEREFMKLTSLNSGNLLRVHLLDLVYENNPDTVPSLEQLYAMLLETLEKFPENH